jgi:hypothetical protein
MVNAILAVDPGGDTGLADFNYFTKTWQTTVLPYEPLVLYGFFITWLRSKATNVVGPKGVTVICESFDYRPVGKYDFGGSRAIPKVDLTPRNVIGILELACAQHDVEIVWQKPSTVNGDDGRKTKDPSVFWTDAKVKQLGLYKPAHVHEMDAVKHILHYRAFTLRELKLFEALKPPALQTFPATDPFEEVMR